VIDLPTGALRTGGMIAALRATIPPRRTRIMSGSPRDQIAVEAAPPPPRPTPDPTVDPAVGTGRELPKAPVPKRVRRRRGALAGGTMLVTAGALASWVAVGALHLPETSTLGGGLGGLGSRSNVAGAAPSGARATGARAGTDGSDHGDEGVQGSGADDTTDDASRLAPAAQLASGRNTVIIGSDLLFDTNSATLTPKAKRILADLIVQARRQERRGRVVVSGHTDDVGTERYNLSLSRRRAAAVAAVLRAGLASSDMTVESHGYGESRPRKPNTSTGNRTVNRRVAVAFPPEG
jgi:outer membrane protein OmpA-like peptidoglycan-associated protein